MAIRFGPFSGVSEAILYGMSEIGSPAEELLGDMSGSEPEWMKTLTEIARETPDVFSELVPDYDFRGFPLEQARARAIVQTQALVPRADQMLSAEVVSDRYYSSASLNSGFFREFKLDGFGGAICKLAIKRSVRDLLKLSHSETADCYVRSLNEVSAYLIAELIGADYGELFPVTTLRKTKGRVAILSELRDDDPFLGLSIVKGDAINQAAFIDSLFANPDRHRGNYLISSSGDLRLIDHEMCFFYRCCSWDHGFDSPLIAERLNRNASRSLNATEIAALKSLTSGRSAIIIQGLLGKRNANMLFKRAAKMLTEGELL